MKSGFIRWVCGGALALALPALAFAQAPAAVDPAKLQGLASAQDYRPPEGIAFRATDFSSENVRLTAQWFQAAGAEGRTSPTVIMAPGSGATAASLRQDAVDLARAGYLVMLFDYRGWGDSDGRVMLAGGRPADGATFTGEMRQLRGYIDPWEQAEDWLNALSYAVTDPRVDADRVGLLGADLAGGHVVSVAAQDARVKALVSEVTRADLRPYKPYEPDPKRTIAEANAKASRLAAGQAPYPADGTPVGAKLVRWAPVEQADRVAAPALFVLAQKEELFSNTNNGQLACERVTGPRKLMMFPGITHYGVYGAERQRAVTAAIGWFDRYLKAAGAPTGKDPERGPCNPPPVPPKGEADANSGAGHRAQNASGRWN